MDFAVQVWLAVSQSLLSDYGSIDLPPYGFKKVSDDNADNFSAAPLC